MKKLFRDQDYIDVVVEKHRLLFDIDDVAKAAGYASTKSLDHHIKGTRYDVLGKNGKRYLAREGIKYASILANRTPALRSICEWAFKFKVSDIVPPAVKVESPKVELREDFRLYGIREAAEKLGMAAKELGDWLVNQGYAGRYESNKSLYWKDHFEMLGHGTRPVIGIGDKARESNIAKLTQKGFDFVKNRLDSERQSKVLAFARKEANEAEKLEAEVDELIKNEFKKEISKESFPNGVWTLPTEYHMTEVTLIKKVKSIIAQVKLKEKK